MIASMAYSIFASMPKSRWKIGIPGGPSVVPTMYPKPLAS